MLYLKQPLYNNKYINNNKMSLLFISTLCNNDYTTVAGTQHIIYINNIIKIQKNILLTVIIDINNIHHT